MRKFTVVLLTLLLCLLVAAPPVLADDSPLPTPTPPPTTQPIPTASPTPPPLLPKTGETLWPEDPTNLFDVLTWLISGGAGAFVAVWIEKQRWFQPIAGQWKPTVVMGCIALTALLPKLLFDFMPVMVWETLAPYFSVVVTAILLGYPVSQVFHKFVNKP